MKLEETRWRISISLEINLVLYCRLWLCLFYVGKYDIQHKGVNEISVLES